MPSADGLRQGGGKINKALQNFMRRAPQLLAAARKRSHY
jgi:hypothetical protein